jgi:hypothetical protein
VSRYKIMSVYTRLFLTTSKDTGIKNNCSLCTDNFARSLCVGGRSRALVQVHLHLGEWHRDARHCYRLLAL